MLSLNIPAKLHVVHVKKLFAMEDYATLSEAMNGLKKEGFTEEFVLEEDHIQCCSENIRLKPEDFRIIRFFRFEGASNPADSVILYAIASQDNKYKGLLVNAYGMYAEPLKDELMKKLHITEHTRSS